MVALVGVPQCLAYAMMSGLPPAYGLSTAVVAGLVAAVAGRSAQVITGPTNTTSLLIVAALAPYLGANGLLGSDGLPVLATLTLLAGLIRLVAGYGGGAFLVRFIPESVLVGFTAGAGVLIGMMQLDEALGLAGVNSSSFLSELRGLERTWSQTHILALVVTVATVVVLALSRRWSRKVPAALFVVIATTAAAAAFGLDAGHGLPLVGERSTVALGWPPSTLPAVGLDMWRALLVPACAIVLLGTLELTVTARAGGARPDLGREIQAQGWANVAGAFLGAMPASTSLTRSALVRLGGGQTRVAAAVAAMATAPILFFGGRLAGMIPQASLAGVLLYIAYRMVDHRAMKRLWRASPDTRILLLVTLLSALLLPLEWAILLGSGIGLVIHLARTAAPRIEILKADGARLLPVAPGDQPDTVVVVVSGDLHYAAVPPFMDQAERLIPVSARTVVLDLSHAHQIRFSALRALEDMDDARRRLGGQLALAGLDEDARGLLQRAESPLRYIAAEAEPGLSARKAIAMLAGETHFRE
jgi:SulP family sulfate permease